MDRLGAGRNQPWCPFFFLWVREFFVLHRMVGRTWRGVLTPGYFEPCNFLSPVVSDSLQPLGLQHARPPCPSLSLRVCSGSCPLSRWCYPNISSSATLSSFCLQSFPASGSFPCPWESCSVMSDSLRPHGLYSPRDSPGQNTGVGSCSLL